MTYDQGKLAELTRACHDALTSTEKGAALENLVEYVFTRIPSVELYQRDVKDAAGAQEIDLVFGHIVSESGIPIPDVTIMIECKNEADRTTAPQIREFATKLSTRSLSKGVLVTTAGITGTAGTAGHEAIETELARGVVIIVVLRSELEALTGPHSLVELLRARVLELQTYRRYPSLIRPTS